MSAPLSTDSAVLPRLKRLIRAARLPHAVLFVGADFSATQRCATEAARAIHCAKCAADSEPSGCGLSECEHSECEHCKLINSGNHPDLQVLDCSAFDGDAMESLRTVLTTSYRKPFLAASRVTLLLRSNELSTAAHNLLLKTLEEPRPGNYYILTTSSASLLPSTIVSRAQVWFFPDNVSAIPSLEPEEADPLLTQLSAVAKGEMHSAVLLATKIHKEFKDRISLVISTFSRHAREQVFGLNDHHSNIHRWSRFLGDLSDLEYTIGTRNFNSQYQFVAVFERLAK